MKSTIAVAGVNDTDGFTRDIPWEFESLLNDYLAANQP
jgi:hypothetical protein